MVLTILLAIVIILMWRSISERHTDMDFSENSFKTILTLLVFMSILFGMLICK